MAKGSARKVSLITAVMLLASGCSAVGERLCVYSSGQTEQEAAMAFAEHWNATRAPAYGLHYTLSWEGVVDPPGSSYDKLGKLVAGLLHPKHCSSVFYDLGVRDEARTCMVLVPVMFALREVPLAETRLQEVRYAQ